MLECTAPQIGQVALLTLTSGTPNAAGLLYASGIPAAPYPLGAGCEVQVDLATAIAISPVATDGVGFWGLGVFIPFDLILVGNQFVLQSALYPTSGPLGFDLSNGVNVTLGY